MTPSQGRRFVVSGTIEEEETGRPLPGLIVRAFDRDLVLDDKLGFATTDDDGRFHIRYREEDFRDWRETLPDLYLRVLDARGAHVLAETSDAIRFDASEREQFHIRVPARALSGRSEGR